MTSTSSQTTKTSMSSQTTRHRIIQLMKVHLTLVMASFAGLGAVVLGVGVYLGIPLMTAFGSSLFSAALVSVIFKIIGYDLYLKDVLEQTLTDHDTIATQNLGSALEQHHMQVQETIRRILTRLEFVELLSENECKDLVKTAISAWKRGDPQPAIYSAFEKVAEELVELVDENRYYSIILEPAKSYGDHIMRSKITFKCRRCNEATVEKGLFPDGIVTDARITVPRTLDVSKIRITPEELGRCYDLRINDTSVDPEVDENRWNNPANFNEGTKQIVKCFSKIPPKTSWTVAHEAESLLDDSDYIIRRFTTFTNGVDVEVYHPAGFDIEAVWFRPKEVRVHDPKKETKVYRQSAEGIFFPGDGFIIIAKRRK